MLASTLWLVVFAGRTPRSGSRRIDAYVSRKVSVSAIAVQGGMLCIGCEDRVLLYSLGGKHFFGSLHSPESPTEFGLTHAGRLVWLSGSVYFADGRKPLELKESVFGYSLATTGGYLYLLSPFLMVNLDTLEQVQGYSAHNGIVGKVGIGPNDSGFSSTETGLALLALQHRSVGTRLVFGRKCKVIGALTGAPVRGGKWVIGNWKGNVTLCSWNGQTKRFSRQKGTIIADVAFDGGEQVAIASQEDAKHCPRSIASLFLLNLRTGHKTVIAKGIRYDKVVWALGGHRLIALSQDGRLDVFAKGSL
jgi:hypothetical protein